MKYQQRKKRWQQRAMKAFAVILARIKQVSA